MTQCLGHLRGCFYCRHRIGLKGLVVLTAESGLPYCRVLGGQWSWLATSLLGSKQPAAPSTYVTNPACAAKDPFEKQLNESENITLVVSLLYSCVEKTFC